MTVWDNVDLSKIPLRDYQKEGVRFLCNNLRCGLVDEPGLGKTIQVLVAVACQRKTPVIIFAPKCAIGVWRDEIIKWLGPQFASKVIFYQGTAAQRLQLAKSEAMKQAAFVITSYRMCLELIDAKSIKGIKSNKNSMKLYLPRWAAVICDEYHRVGLLNIKTDTYKAIRALVKENDAAFYAVSGTPYTKGPQDFYGMLHLFDPKNVAYNSYWRFVRENCILLDNPFGYTQIHPRPKEPEKFRLMLQRHFLRRRKADVLEQLPPKTRQVISIEMSPKQAKMYKTLEHELMLLLEKGELVTALTPLELIIKLRQLLVSPKCLDSNELDVGAGLEVLVEMVDIDFDAGNSVLIFTPFVRGVELIAEELKKKLSCDTYVVHGQLKSKQLPSDIANEFQMNKTHKKVLVCTIKTGQAWTATDANVVYFLGYEWAAVENGQAEDRVHRIGQRKSVICKYIKYVNTIDEDILQVILEKELGFSASLDAKKFAQQIKRRFEAYD